MTAILLKEFRSYLRGARPFTLLTVYMTLISVLFMLVYAGGASSPFTNRASLGTQLFSFTVGLALLQLVFLAPALNSSALGSERDRQTIDLLMITPLRRIMIILGKLIAPSIFLILLSIAVLPLGGLAFMIGGIEPRDLIVAFLLMVGTALGYGSIGIWAAARTRTSRGGTLMAQAICFMLAIGIPFIGIFVVILLDNNNMLQDVMESFLRYPIFLIVSLSPFVGLFGWLGAIEGNQGTAWTIDLPAEMGGGTIPQFWILSLILWLIIVPLLLWRSARQLPKSLESHGG